jgi:hypothetical protein
MPRTQKPRVFAHSTAGAQVAAAAVTDESYTQQGATTNFVVFYAASLGDNGPALADAVLATCESDYARLQTWFGNIAIANLPFTSWASAWTRSSRTGDRPSPRPTRT